MKEISTMPTTAADVTAPAHPWRRVLRTLLAVLPPLCALAPAVYQAATNHDPQAASGLAATGLAIAAGITRVLALPAVEGLLRKYLPVLSAGDVQANRVVALVAQQDPIDGVHKVVAGDAAVQPTGTLLPRSITVAQMRPGG